MKKLLILVLSLIMVLSISGCTKKYVLPEIEGLSLVEAKELLGENVQISIVNKETIELDPGIVIGYLNNKANDSVKIGSLVDIEVSKLPEDSVIEIVDDSILYGVHIGKLTGPDSFNEDILKEAGISGTDLGFQVDLGDEIIFLFGDTFSGEKQSGMWFSNFIATTKDRYYDDGLTFDSVVSRESGMAIPFAQGAHQADSVENTGSEVTKIPTGAIKIGEYVYIFYMSVRHWGANATWLINYNQCIKSKDLVNWENVLSLRWEEEEAPNFGQIFPFKDPHSDYIYLYSVPGGRHGKMVLARVLQSNFENRDEYEYEVAYNTWVKGNEGLLALKENPFYIMNSEKGEVTVNYNEYLGKYMMIYLNGMYLSDTPYGPFDEPIIMFKNVPYYGNLTSNALMKDNGKTIYMIGSYWGPNASVYNTFLIKIVLK